MGESETFIDPWSRKPIADEPVTNKKCKHTYEKATVMKFLEKHSKTKKALKCPIMGCGNNNITMADLYTDPEIKRRWPGRTGVGGRSTTPREPDHVFFSTSARGIK